MSMETAEWLSTMTRIGDTDRRGKAWHYRQGDNNHFPNAVPVEEVRKLVLPYEPVPRPLYITVPATAEEYAKGVEGVYRQTDSDIDAPYFRLVTLDNSKAVTASSDAQNVYGTPSGEYQVHSYEQWLLRNVMSVLDDTEDGIHISSAGLLKGGAVAWVELSLSDTHTVADFPFRPHLLAFTSANGSYKTSYKRAVQAVVCDNTLFAASKEKGQTLAFKHTKNSPLLIADARAALGIVMETADDFEAEVNGLLDWKVNSRQFSQYLDLTVPVVDGDGDPIRGRALTLADDKRERLAGMWRNDPRIAPWSGTAFGVLQLNNTFQHHEKGANKSTIRPERNMLSAISGETARSDQSALLRLSQVSESPLSVSVGA
jgi:phage/plasmid-like protein (TIGR03299 family)